jgi:hypothetical protein
MGSVYLNFGRACLKFRNFKQDVSLSETYVKPVIMNTQWFPYRFLWVELAQVHLLVSVNLCSLRLTRLSTEWSVKQLTRRFL